MDMETLGYFLYMEECERTEQQKEESAAVGEYKVNSNDDLVADMRTYNGNIKRF